MRDDAVLGRALPLDRGLGPKTTEKRILTARSDKSVAYVTNNKRLYSTFYTVEANY